MRRVWKRVRISTTSKQQKQSERETGREEREWGERATAIVWRHYTCVCVPKCMRNHDEVDKKETSPKERENERTNVVTRVFWQKAEELNKQTEGSLFSHSLYLLSRGSQEFLQNFRRETFGFAECPRCAKKAFRTHETPASGRIPVV